MPDKKAAAMIEQLAGRLELALDKTVQEKLLRYTGLLLQGLQKQRLTGERTAGGLIEKHLYDSLYPLRLLSFADNSRTLDLGSGGGLPGIPVKICLPKIAMYLADANKRKIMFLKETAVQLGLEMVYTIHDRAENIGQNTEYRENYDYVLCRAVAETAVLAELSLPLLKIGGRAIIYKGPRGETELEEARAAIKLCGGRFDEMHLYSLPAGENRSLIILEKVMRTPPQYPRAVGRPNKKPLKG